MQTFHFTIKHMLGKLNQGAGALLRLHLLLIQLDACILGFEHLKGLYKSDEDFWELFIACLKHPKDDFLIHDGYLFKGTRSHVPRSGTHELLVREVHGGSLAGHYGKNKTLMILKERYYWPGMRKTIEDVIRKCATCHVTKSHLLR